MTATGATVALLAAAITALAGSARACDGFKLKNVQLKSCEGHKNVMDMKDVVPDMTDRCTLATTGCLINNKTIESAKFTYVVKKDGVPITQGTTDGCEFLETNKNNPNTRPFLDVANMPPECPIPVGQICANGKEASLNKFRGAMAAYVGKYTGDFQLDFPDGTEACFRGAFELVGPMGGGGGGFF